MSESVYPTPSPAYRFWKALKTLPEDRIVKPVTFSPPSHLFQVTTEGTTGAAEPSWNTSSGGTTTSGDVVFTEIGLLRAGPRPSFYMKLQPDWDSITLKSTYEDKSVDTIRTQAAPPQKWLLRYNNKSETDIKVIDDFVDTVGLDVPFTFIEPRVVPHVSGTEGATFQTCYVESYGAPRDRKRIWANAREIIIVKYVS